MKLKRLLSLFLLASTFMQSTTYSNVLIGTLGNTPINNEVQTLGTSLVDNILSNGTINQTYPHFYVTWDCSLENVTYKVSKSYDGKTYEVVTPETSNKYVYITENSFTSTLPYYAVKITPISEGVPMEDSKSLIIEYGNKETDAPYKITFNTGDYEVLDPIYKYKDGTIRQAIPFPDPNKQDKSFDGWYTDSGLNNKFNSNNTISNDILLYPKIVDADTSYTTEIYLQNIDGTYTKDTIINKGLKGGVVSSNVRIPNGYIYDNSNENSISSLVVGAGGTLKEYYNRIEYNVKFETFGGSTVENQKVKYEGLAKQPINPTKSGMAFYGWYKDKEFNQPFTFSVDKIKDNTILYAKWVPEGEAQYNYTVNLYGEDTSGKPVIMKTVNLKGTLNEVINYTPEAIEGYTFNSTNVNNRLSGTVNKEGTLVLSAYYNRNSYNVFLDVNGGNPINNANTIYKYGDVIKIPSNPTRNGYTFKGWTTVKNGSTLYNFSNPVTSNLTLYASWETFIDTTKAKYTVMYYGEDLDGDYELIESENLTGTIGDSVKADQKKFEGFEFNDDYSKNIESGEVTSDGNLILKLYYDRLSYDVEVDVDGDGDLDRTTSIKYGEEYYDALPNPVNKSSNLEFAGWYTKPDGKGTFIKTSLELDEDSLYKEVYAYFDKDGIKDDDIEDYEDNDMYGFIDYEDGGIVDDASITLYSSNKKIETAKVNSYGIYYFEDLNDGYYTVVIEDNNTDTINTFGIYLDTDKGRKDFEITEDNLSTEIVFKDTSKNITITNLYDIIFNYVKDNSDLEDILDSSSNEMEYTLRFTEFDNAKDNDTINKIITDKGLSKNTNYMFDLTLDEYYKKSSKSYEDDVDKLDDFMDIKIPLNSSIKDVKIYYNDGSSIKEVSNSYSSSKLSYKLDTSTNILTLSTNVLGEYVITNGDFNNTIQDNSNINFNYSVSNIKYNITPNVSYCSVKFDKANYSNGDTVHMQIIPTGSHKITLVKYNNTDYSSSMKDNVVTIENVVTSTPIIIGCSCSSSNFKDVSSTSWYHNYIDFVVDNKYMNGYSSNQFSPDLKVTRAQMAQILYNLHKGTKVSTNKKVFVDVTEDMWCYDVINWCYSNGYMSGKGGNKFDPDGYITREELVQVLYNYDKVQNIVNKTNSSNKNLSSFKDSYSVSSWAKTAVEWAVKYSVISGDTNNNVNTKSGATRAEIATILYNIFNK